MIWSKNLCARARMCSDTFDDESMLSLEAVQLILLSLETFRCLVPTLRLSHNFYASGFAVHLKLSQLSVSDWWYGQKTSRRACEGRYVWFQDLFLGSNKSWQVSHFFAHHQWKSRSHGFFSDVQRSDQPAFKVDECLRKIGHLFVKVVDLSAHHIVSAVLLTGQFCK